MNTPTDILAVHAAAKGTAPAVIVDGSGGAVASVTTFAEFNSMVNRLAHGLAASGARYGERLVWCGPNSLEVLVSIHAARKLGLVAVPLSYRFNAEEMAYVIDNSDATVVVADAEFAPLIASVQRACPKVRTFAAFLGDAPSGWSTLDTLEARQSDEEPSTLSPEAAISGGAQMIYTSGTTGKPKGALRTRTDPALVGALLAELGYFHDDPVHLTTGPLYHSGPLAFAVLAQTLGAPVNGIVNCIGPSQHARH